MVNMQDKKVKIKQKTTETYEKIMEVDDAAKDVSYTELDWDT
jgi:hypothetical protein